MRERCAPSRRRHDEHDGTTIGDNSEGQKVACAILLPAVSLAAQPGTVRYVYDELGRLAAVIARMAMPRPTTTTSSHTATEQQAKPTFELGRSRHGPAGDEFDGDVERPGK